MKPIVFLLYPGYVTIAGSLAQSPKLEKVLKERGILDGQEIVRGFQKASPDEKADLLRLIDRDGNISNTCPEMFSGAGIVSQHWDGTIDSIPVIDTSDQIVMLRSSSMQECSDNELVARARELGYLCFYYTSIVNSDGSWGCDFEGVVGKALDELAARISSTLSDV